MSGECSGWGETARKCGWCARDEVKVRGKGGPMLKKLKNAQKRRVRAQNVEECAKKRLRAQKAEEYAKTEAWAQKRGIRTTDKYLSPVESYF